MFQSNRYLSGIVILSASLWKWILLSIPGVCLDVSCSLFSLFGPAFKYSFGKIYICLIFYVFFIFWHFHRGLFSPLHSSIRQLWSVWPSLRIHWLSIKQITTTWVMDVLFLFIVCALLWNFIWKFLTMIFVKFTF